MKKKILSLCLSLALFVCCLSVFTSCGKSNNDETMAYVSLDINPGIELVVDKNSNVVGVRAENEDGLILLYNETGIKGENIDTAINKIINLAVEYGYLDDSNKTVGTIVTSSDSNFANSLLNRVNSKITVTAQNLNISVTTDSEGAYSLIRKFDEFKKDFPNNSAIQNMSISKFRLALSVSETGEISLESAVELDEKELIKMLKNASDEIENFATKAYLTEKTKAMAIYDEVAKIQAYSAYTEYYLSHVTSHLTTAYYGPAYQMYVSASTAFNAVLELVKIADDVNNYEINESDINAVLSALGMSSADELKNSDGKITLESIEEYADKLFKNTPASNSITTIKENLTRILNELESDIKSSVKKQVDAYLTQINDAKTNVENILTNVEKLVPTTLKPMFNQITADLNEILETADEVVQGGTVDVAKLKTLTNKLETKANDYLSKIKNDLSETEYAELEALFNTKLENMSTKKTEMNTAITNAENSAKAKLEALKNDRKKKN